MVSLGKYSGVSCWNLLAVFLSLSWCSIGQVMAQEASPDDVWASPPNVQVTDFDAPLNVIVDKSRVMVLNIDQLQSILSNAPLDSPELPENQRPLPSTLYLPDPDGGFVEFEFRRTQLLAPELAAKYPEITTYRGVSVKDSSITVNFDFTPSGFHAQVLDPGNRWFIDPQFKNNTVRYLSYRRASKSTDSWQCLVESDIGERVGSSSIEAGRSGDIRRTYRLAVAATGEYSQFHGGTVPSALAAITTTVNRVTGIYEKELAVSFQLVANNDSIVFTDPLADPFNGNNSAGVLIGESQTVIDDDIGSANYDVGHTFSTGAGGLASLGVICDNASKARGVTGSSNPAGDAFDVDFVAHEIGHQFSGNHTFNGSQGNCSGTNRNGSTAYEPGSGTTIQAYAGICGADNIQNNSDAIFHSESHAEMMAHVTSGSGATCGVNTALTNAIPTANAGNNFTIPKSTPFLLTGSGTDADAGDGLTFSWEQRSLGPQAALSAVDDGQIPLFRTLIPKTDSFRFLPELADVVGNIIDNSEKLPSVARVMDWRLTVRDNQGGVESDDSQITVDGVAGPFTVIDPNGGETVSNSYNVQWNVAGTNTAPVSSANVDMFLSTDGGLTFDFNNPLVTAVPNDGQQTVNFPATPTSAARIMIRGNNHIFYDVSDANFVLNGGGVGFCATGNQANLSVEDWESGNTTSWIQNDLLSTNQWINSSSNPDQGLRHLHVDNPSSTTDSAFEMVNDVLLPAGAFINVQHQYDFEMNWDGGVMEYSTDQGTTWSDISTLPIMTGSYPETLNASANPLGGRVAFTGTITSYIGTMVDLSSLSGSNFRLRMRVGSDESVSASGWDIDEVAIFTCSSTEPSVEANLVSSCLAGNGRVDLNIVNTQTATSEYRLELQGQSPRQSTVLFEDWGRMPITGRPDGSYTTVVKRDSVIIMSKNVEINCDDPSPTVSSPEVTIVDACRAGNGQVFFQMVNPTSSNRAYVIEFDGVPNRSTTAAPFGQALRGTTGRPDGVYNYLVRTGSTVVDTGTVEVDCD